MEQGTPRLSVVIATREPWPAVAPALDALAPQLADADAELVLVDGHGSALGDDVRDRVVHVRAPGQDVFGLRAAGLAAARGEIVAFTEDHCVPHASFCAAVLRAHADHPQALVAGAVVNGSPETAIDRANFLVVHGDNLPPLASPAPYWIPTPTNMSLKRRVVPEEEPAPGWVELVLAPWLLARDEVALDDRPVVSHVQRTGWLGTFANHFDAARSVASLSRDLLPHRGRRWILTGTIAIARGLVQRALRARQRGLATAAEVYPLLPLVVGLAIADALGFVWGAVAGPGRSRLRVQ